MKRPWTAPPPKEARQGALQETEVLEVVVVGDLAAEPLPHRLDRIQVGAVGRQEAKSQAGPTEDELEETGTPMPGCAIEDQHHQYRGIGSEELLTESLEADRGEPTGEAAMELARDDVEGPEAVNLLVGAGPVAGPWLFAGEAPLPAEGRGELDRHLVLEEDGQAMGSAGGQVQEPSELPFFFRRRQGGTVGS